METKNRIILTSAAVAIALLAAGLAIGDVAVLGNIVVIAIFVSVIPIVLYRYSRYMRIKAIEAQFPNFVRDLADSKRSGMSFKEAVNITTKTNYGKLSPEIEKMKNRMSWGTPFLRAVEIFGEGMKESKPVSEALGIIMESFKSGGKVADTLESVASDMLMIKEAEAERSSMVKQHVMIIYGIFFMFLVISILIIFVFIPMLKQTPGGIAPSSSLPSGASFKDPCENTRTSFPCNLFTGTCVTMGVSTGITCYYIALFFMVVVIQGIFMGLIAGQLGENSIIAGTKHSMIMVMIGVSVFMFVARAGLFPA